MKKYFLLILLFLLFGCTSNNKNLEETKINYDIILKLKETTKIVPRLQIQPTTTTRKPNL